MTFWMQGLALVFATALGVAGCGGDDDDDPLGDGDADADADGDGDADGVFVLTSDFASSVYGWAPLAELGAFEELGPAEGDAVAVRSAARIGILERTLGAATLLGPDFGIERNFSVADEEGPAPNPHDMAIVSDTKAYVARFGQGTLAIVDPSTGTIRGTVDLSSHDPDGIPDMDAVTIVGDRALVSLERLDDTFAPRGDSEVVVIDTATDAVTRTIQLPLANPSGRFRLHRTTGELLLGCVAAYGAADGGIVGLGPDEDAPRVLLTEQALGGDLGAFVVADDTHGFAIVAVSFVTRLVPFDPSTGTVGEPLLVSEGYDLADLELVGDALVVADAAPSAPGLRVYSLEGAERTTGPVSVGLPPRVVLAL